MSKNPQASKWVGVLNGTPVRAFHTMEELRQWMEVVINNDPSAYVVGSELPCASPDDASQCCVGHLLKERLS